MVSWTRVAVFGEVERGEVLNGSSREEWVPQWNSTWALKNETWTQMGIEEARELEAEMKYDGEGGKGKVGVWKWYNGQYMGTRTFG